MESLKRNRLLLVLVMVNLSTVAWGTLREENGAPLIRAGQKKYRGLIFLMAACSVLKAGQSLHSGVESALRAYERVPTTLLKTKDEKRMAQALDDLFRDRPAVKDRAALVDQSGRVRVERYGKILVLTINESPNPFLLAIEVESPGEFAVKRHVDGSTTYTYSLEYRTGHKKLFVREDSERSILEIEAESKAEWPGEPSVVLKVNPKGLELITK